MWIAAHEYLHTWTPLNIYSEQIEDFNFDQPYMSRHLWFYEGVTDYLADLVTEVYNLNRYSDFTGGMQ